MKINEVKVSAGRTFNHPFESYSNLRCDVHLQAVLEDGEDPKAATQQLQAQAEEAAETHKQSLLSSFDGNRRAFALRILWQPPPDYSAHGLSPTGRAIWLHALKKSRQDRADRR